MKSIKTIMNDELLFLFYAFLPKKVTVCSPNIYEKLRKISKGLFVLKNY